MSGAFKGFSTAVVIDLETTGLNPSSHRIVSIAALRADFYALATRHGANVDTFVTRVNPQQKIPASVSNIHGIFDSDVAHEEPFADIAAQLRDFIGDGPIIGHNISFDKSFLSAEFQRSHIPIGRIRSLCTMSRMCALLETKGIYRSTINLKDACREFSVSYYGSKYHDALEDAKATLQIAGAMYKLDNGYF